jgi:protein-S-isoprenylcysteine O-methyltransferase Ste14
MQPHSEAAAVSRILIFVYGISCYAISLAVLVYGMGFIVGLYTPTMLDGVPNRPLGAALGIDLGLILVFALQHSIMARPAFKAWWTRFVPEPAERSTYILMSSIALGALFALWEPIGGTVWHAADGAVREIVLGLYVLGWLLLLYTTFLIDHFDLFGLTQVWRQLTGKAYRAPQFHTPSLYKLVRHPLYIGWLTIMWAAPTMTISHLLFAVATTVYILIAIRYEERDLVGAFGERYELYREHTPMLIPRVPGRDRPGLVSGNRAGE